MPHWAGTREPTTLVPRPYSARVSTYDRGRAGGVVTTGDQAGLADLAALLIRRDRWRAQPLPLLCLRHGAGTASPLIDLASRMPGRDHRPRAPNAQPDLASPRPDPTSKPDPTPGDGETGDRLPTLLRAIIDGLTANEFGTDPLAFRHLELALAVMKIDLKDAKNLHDRRRTVARMLREQPGHKVAEELAGQGEQVPGLPGLVYLVISLLPKLIFWIRASVLVPGLGRQFRWFTRQPFMTPTLSSGGFLGFATRLSVKPRTDKDRTQVHLLLMHAFLEDLRRAYRRRPWRLQGWRRTAHPVVLLDEAAPDASEPIGPGAELLRLINDVRNETGLLDPLVVVYAAHTLPPETLCPPPWTPPPAAEAVKQYADWKKATQRRGWRLGPPNGWYLPLTVATPALDAIREAAGVPNPITTGRPPWWSHRAVPIVACVALVTGLTSWCVIEVAERCGTVLTHGRVAIQRCSPARIWTSASATVTTPASCSAVTATPAKDRLSAHNR
jgi:hypothetical protein